MGLMAVTYCISGFINGTLLFSRLQAGEAAASHDSPYRYIFYSVIILSATYLIARGQMRLLFSTRNLLKEKENALKVIEDQKSILEHREKEITDSLIYAKRIQEALLPSEPYLRKYLENAFILYKPKDIVSGDFYWIGQKGENVFIVAADCTGHGVPGAIMSMIGLEIIERTLNKGKFDLPSQILSILDLELEKTFSREKNEGNIIRDGMDIGLCRIDIRNRKLIFSGSFFPMYMIRNNTLTEIKSDKIVIGMNPEANSFTDQEIDLEADDIFYLFSDGYVDQFGGEEQRKFMYRRFRYLLLTIHRFPVEDQKSILEENLRSWMGENVQVDDIMIIGFKPVVS